MSENNIYRIEAHSYDILGAASHNFWVLRGPDGSIIQELHGLAWDEEKDREKTIGTIGDDINEDSSMETTWGRTQLIS